MTRHPHYAEATRTPLFPRATLKVSLRLSASSRCVPELASDIVIISRGMACMCRMESEDDPRCGIAGIT